MSGERLIKRYRKKTEAIKVNKHCWREYVKSVKWLWDVSRVTKLQKPMKKFVRTR